MVIGGWDVQGYDDLEVLGRGGFATVYRARQVAFDREVALKVLDGTGTDERTIQLFTRECRAAGALSWHPHVVPVYDAGRTSHGAPYLAMELLPGGSLEDALDISGPLAAADAVAAVIDIADALAAAHDEGLLHRDVKPANVLLDRRGRARLTDFGISRVAGAGSATSTGVVGTMAFMAPEVLGGRKATPASDIYALALTLVTLLSGRNPFVADTDDSPFAVIARVMAGTMAVPDAVPKELRPLVEAWTSPQPADRPSDAGTARNLLAAIDLDQPGLPAESSRPAPITRPFTPPPEPLVGPVTRAVRRIPPPPISAVKVRSDHTLALPPAPPDPDAGTETDEVEFDLSEWPWGLERRLIEHLDAAGVAYVGEPGAVAVARSEEIRVDEAVEDQLELWAAMQHRFGAGDRRLLAACRRAAERLSRDTWDRRSIKTIDGAASRFDAMGAPDDVEHIAWRALTVAVDRLNGALENEAATDDEVSVAASDLVCALDTLRSGPSV